MKYPDEWLEKLGTYFIYHDIATRFGISFERFVYLVDKNVWKDVVA